MDKTRVALTAIICITIVLTSFSLGMAPNGGRLPVIKASQTEKYHESRKVRTTLTVYRLQCPRGHISTSWFSHAALASRQWKELVDEYKGKDTK